MPENELPTTPGTVIIAGKDIMWLDDHGIWNRDEDESKHDSAGVWDFHGHSGYTILPGLHDMMDRSDHVRD